MADLLVAGPYHQRRKPAQLWAVVECAGGSVGTSRLVLGLAKALEND